MKKKNFIKVVENFTCENCGTKVIGNGYTNHCPKCLWSKHVDLKIPGDRANPCGGLMEPIGVKQKKGKFRIVSQCVRCGFIHVNDISDNDNMNLIIELSKNPISL